MSSFTDYVTSGDRAGVAGIAASVVIGASLGFLSLFIILCCCRGTPSAELSHVAKSWQPRARSSWGLVFAAHFFLVLGLLMGLAAPAIPWVSYSDSSGFEFNYTAAGLYYQSICIFSTCISDTSVVFNIYSIGTVISYIALIALVFPACILTFVAAARLHTVAVSGVMPAVSCCAPSSPAMQGVAWTGTLITFAGAILNWILWGTWRFDTFSSTFTTSAGAALMGASIASLFLGTILVSIAGCCCIGHLPGIGTSATNCCGVELNAGFVDAAGAAAPYSATAPAERDLTLRAHQAGPTVAVGVKL